MAVCRDSVTGRRGRRPPKRVKPVAYAYATGDGPPPDEYLLLGYLDRFGVQAVLGRTLGAGEMFAMQAAESVIKAVRSREASGNWAEWTQQNRAAAKLLAQIERA